jgi:adenylate cyclase
LKRFWLSTALLFVVTFALGSLASSLFEKRIYDQKVRLFSRRSAAPIVLVELDQESLDFYSRNFNLSFPWPRSLYARAIDFLSAAGARAVGLDMIFSEASAFGEDDDRKLAEAASRAGDVFMPVLFSQRREAGADLARFALARPPALAGLPERPGMTSLPVPPLLASLRGIGNAFFAMDRDGVFRRLPHFVRHGGRVYPSFPLALALWSDPRLELGRVPFAADGGLNVRFPARGSFPRYSISQLIQSQVRLEEGRPPFVPAAAVRGKMVLIGATAPGLLDNRPTPLSAVGAGFELHAAALANFLEREYVRVADPRLQWLLVLLAVGLMNVLLFRVRSIQRQLLAAGAALLLALAAVLFLFYLGLDFDFLPLGLGLVACTGYDVYHRYHLMRREKKFIQNAFKNYLSDSLLAEVMKNPQGLNLGGEKKKVTVFFSDLAGFTTMSEALSPEGVVRILNAYLERMTSIIMDGGGFVNKFEGDAIMAFWGAPIAAADQAAQAMKAALRCQEDLLGLNDDFARDGLPRLGMRIGINSGEVIVGNIGSRQRFEYTVIGDAVNLASRLEGINKQYGTRIICGATAAGMAAGEMLLRRLDRVRVKGKKIPEEIFEVVAVKERAPAELPQRLERFEEGLRLYFSGDFSSAMAIFASLADDPPALVFARRCRWLLDNPPGEWDGCWTFTEK